MDDKKKKKGFLIPQAEILDFQNVDIITLSWADLCGDDWGTDDNGEGGVF